MIKKSDTIKNPTLLFKSFSLVAITLLILSAANYIVAFVTFPKPFDGEWWTSPLLTLDYPLRIVVPLLMFVTTYVVIKRGGRWPRLFYASVITLSYILLELLLFGLLLIVSEPGGNYGAAMIHVVLPHAVPFVGLAIYAYILGRSDAPLHGHNKSLRALIIFSLFAIVSVLTFSLVVSVTSGGYANMHFDLYSSLSFSLPIITIVVLAVSYVSLWTVKRAIERLYLSTLVASVFAFTLLLGMNVYISGKLMTPTVIGSLVASIVLAAGLTYVFHKSTSSVISRKK